MTTRHQPARDNSALIDTAVRVLAAMSTTPLHSDDDPAFMADLAWRRASALWDLIDAQASWPHPADTRVPDAEDCWDPAAADRLAQP